MKYLLDTHIISELRKGDRCHPAVAAWFASVDDDELFISTLVLGEIRRGIEIVRPKSPERAAELEVWLENLIEGYSDSTIPVDRMVADVWGRLSSRRTLPTIDGLLAATAVAHDLVLVTRNTSDITDLNAVVLNPFLSP